MSLENLPNILTIQDVQKILRIGRCQAYELAKRPDFPKLPINKPIRIPRDAFLQWAKLV